MKTTFSRQLTLTLSLILLAMIIMAGSFRPLLRSYLLSSTRKQLESNAQTIAKLAAAYDASGELAANWGFRISLDFASQVAGTDEIVCDKDGKVILCTCGELYCEHLDRTLPEDLVTRTMQQGSASGLRKLDGLYDQERYFSAVRITSEASGESIGMVVATAQLTQVNAVLEKSMSYQLLCAAVVLLIAVVACSIVARSQARPLKEMANVAARFGHGDMSARAEIGGTNTLEMDELAAAFNSMAENLAKSEQRRSEFVANVSHELKTPMTTIAGFMDGMLDGTIPEDQHRRYMQAVSDEVRRLARLVRQMLEISRMQAEDGDTIHWQVFDLCESLGQSLITFEQRIEAKRLDVEVDIPEEGCKVLAAQDAVTQVIHNLLDNAVKFAPEDGLLRVELHPKGDKAVTTITNTGPTIPPEELSLLFDRFHKTDKSRSEDRDGVGLGLYIVKAILDEHGEDITVESREGLTSFRFTLPLA